MPLDRNRQPNYISSLKPILLHPEDLPKSPQRPEASGKKQVTGIPKEVKKTQPPGRIAFVCRVFFFVTLWGRTLAGSGFGVSGTSDCVAINHFVGAQDLH